MPSANQYPGIDHRIVASVRHHARRASPRLAGLDLEDVEQELMLHAHRRLNSYDASRADLWTFADRVLSNFVANLAKTANTMSRGRGISRVSLDDPHIGRDSEPIEEAAGDLGSTGPGWCEQIHLRQDLDRVLQSLPQHLQDSCKWLATDTVTEAARHSNLTRGSLYSRIATLKRAFTAAGLEAYVVPLPGASDLGPVSDP